MERDNRSHDAWLWINKGLSLTYARSHTEAIQCYDKAISIYPNLSSTWED